MTTVEDSAQVVFRLREQSLDEVPMGVVRLSVDERITYVNKAVRDTLGAQIDIGTSLSDLALDDEDRKLLLHAIERRFGEEQGEAYRIKVNRTDSDTRLYLEVIAVPEYDAAGKLIGSIGFVRNATSETMASAIHADIQGASSADGLLRQLTRRLHQVIHFESLRVSLVSKSGNYLRTFFEDALTPLGNQGVRWWLMPDFIKLVLKEMEPGAASIDEMFARPDFQKLEETDELARNYRKHEYKYMLRLPVSSDGQVKATLVLERRGDKPFSAEETACFLELPIVEVVRMALSLERQDELEFAFTLIRKLGDKAGSIGKMAKKLVTKLQEKHGWEHVSLFRMDDDKRQLQLIFQWPPGGLKDGYAQSIDDGLLGLCARTLEPLNIGNVRDNKLAPGYVLGVEGTVSEMCLPVPGAKLTWILNVESKEAFAFADDEQATVERLLTTVGFILDRTASLEMKAAILDSVADAVILTTAENRVIELNPAAEELLGRKLSDFGDQVVWLSDLVKAKDDGAAVAENTNPGARAWSNPPTENAPIDDLQYAKHAPSAEYKIVRPDGTPVRVMISAATLPPNLGAKVYVASNLDEQDRVARMERLKKVFEQVATETRMPIALAYAFLSETLDGKTNVPALVDKALKQLRKADLPLERIIRLASDDEELPLPCGPVPVRALLNEIIDELPGSEAGAVTLASGDFEVKALASRGELKFCLQSVVAFLMRRRAQTEVVEVKLSSPNGRPAALISARLLADKAQPPAAAAHASTDDDRMLEYTLAEQVVDRLIRNMGGEYERRGSAEFSVALRLEGVPQ